jgi:hypothetical protein
MRAPNPVILGITLLVSTAGAIDSKVCAQCHAEIYRRYSAEPMARTSGVVDNTSSFISGTADFADNSTGTRVRVSREGEGTFIHYSKGDAEGKRQLNYFIGAGVVGRSYASMIEGFLFQAPVSYYTSTAQWDLSPGFKGLDHPILTRPIEPACLNCHASGLRTVADTVNRYEDPPFEEAGVSCERCHGSGETHVARMRSGDTRR